MNTSDPDEINAAYEWLLQMNDTMSPVYVTDEVIDGMMNGYKDLAVVYPATPPSFSTRTRT